jgi:hypothetical protein
VRDYIDDPEQKQIPVPLHVTSEELIGEGFLSREDVAGWDTKTGDFPPKTSTMTKPSHQPLRRIAAQFNEERIAVDRSTRREGGIELSTQRVIACGASMLCQVERALDSFNQWMHRMSAPPRLPMSFGFIASPLSIAALLPALIGDLNRWTMNFS